MEGFSDCGGGSGWNAYPESLNTVLCCCLVVALPCCADRYLGSMLLYLSFFMEPPVPNFQLVGFGGIFHIFFGIEKRPLKKMYIFPIASRARDFHCSGQQSGGFLGGQGREVACEEWLL